MLILAFIFFLTFKAQQLLSVFDHICMEKACYKFLIVIIIISYFCYNLHVVM